LTQSEEAEAAIALADRGRRGLETKAEDAEDRMARAARRGAVLLEVEEVGGGG
jgi:hypothetical protein